MCRGALEFHHLSMGISDSDKRKLIDGLFVALGVTVFGLNGPFLFQRFGLNVPEAAAAGTVAGAVIGAGLARLLVRRATRPSVGEPAKMDLGGPPTRAGDWNDPPTGARWGTRQTPVPSKAAATEVRIQRALAGFLPDDSADIHVEVRGAKVVLTGTVHSWHDEAEAERIAFDIPDIQQVENRLEVVQ